MERLPSPRLRHFRFGLVFGALVTAQLALASQDDTLSLYQTIRTAVLAGNTNIVLPATTYHVKGQIVLTTDAGADSPYDPSLVRYVLHVPAGGITISGSTSITGAPATRIICGDSIPNTGNKWQLVNSTNAGYVWSKLSNSAIPKIYVIDLSNMANNMVAGEPIEIGDLTIPSRYKARWFFEPNGSGGYRYRSRFAERASTEKETPTYPYVVTYDFGSSAYPKGYRMEPSSEFNFFDTVRWRRTNTTGPDSSKTFRTKVPIRYSGPSSGVGGGGTGGLGGGGFSGGGEALGPTDVSFTESSTGQVDPPNTQTYDVACVMFYASDFRSRLCHVDKIEPPSVTGGAYSHVTLSDTIHETVHFTHDEVFMNKEQKFMLVNTPWDLKKAGQYYYNEQLDKLFFIPPTPNGEPYTPTGGDIINISMPGYIPTNGTTQYNCPIANTPFKAKNISGTVTFSNVQIDTGIGQALDASNLGTFKLDNLVLKSFGDDMVMQRLGNHRYGAVPNSGHTLVTNSIFQDGFGKGFYRQTCTDLADYWAYSVLSFQEEALAATLPSPNHHVKIDNSQFNVMGRLHRCVYTLDLGRGTSDCVISNSAFTDTVGVALWFVGNRIEVANNTFTRCVLDTTDVGAADTGRSIIDLGNTYHDNTFNTILPYNEIASESTHGWGTIGSTTPGGGNKKSQIHVLDITTGLPPTNPPAGPDETVDAYSALELLPPPAGGGVPTDGGFTDPHTTPLPGFKLFVAGIYWDDMMSGQSAEQNHFTDCQYSYVLNGGRDNSIKLNSHAYTSAWNTNFTLADGSHNIFAGGPLRLGRWGLGNSVVNNHEILNNEDGATYNYSPGALKHAGILHGAGVASNPAGDTGATPLALVSSWGMNWLSLDTYGRFSTLPLSSSDPFYMPYVSGAVPVLPLESTTYGVPSNPVGGWDTLNWVNLFRCNRVPGPDNAQDPNYRAGWNWMFNMKENSWATMTSVGPVYDSVSSVPAGYRMVRFRIWYDNVDPGVNYALQLPAGGMKKADETVSVTYKLPGTQTLVTQQTQPDNQGCVMMFVPISAGDKYLVHTLTSLKKLVSVTPGQTNVNLGTIRLLYGDLNGDNHIDSLSTGADYRVYLDALGSSQSVMGVGLASNHRYDWRADLNHDGEVNPTDWSIAVAAGTANGDVLP